MFRNSRRNPIKEIYPHLIKMHLKWVVIQKKQGAPSAKKNLESVFGNANVVKKDKGYYILKAINK